MTVAKMTYADAYDVGLEDALLHRRPRHSAPRVAHASAGRFGYSDGFSDGLQRRKLMDASSNVEVFDVLTA